MATICDINKQDSNITGLSFAEEVCLNVLPSVANGDPSDPIWYALEPNSYPDFGGDLKMVARTPINPSRQNKKGTPVDLDASSGLNTDVTNDPAVRRLLQGFYFADIREKPTTMPMNGAVNDIGAVTAADDKYATGATAVAFNKAGYIVKASGFGIAANNGLHLVVSADANDITVGDGLVNEAAPPVAAKLEVVGFQFASADVAIAMVGNVATLTSAANVLNTLGLIVGEWIFIGGDTLASNRFANNVGFARISSIAAGVLTFDDITWAGVNEVSTGKTIRIWFGSIIKNENIPALVKKRSVQFERTLGEGPTSTQAEYLTGSMANQMTLNIPTADKCNVDLNFVSCGVEYRTGEVGDELKDGARVAAYGGDAFNSTSDVYRLKMNVVDPSVSNPEALFGYITEGNITINNGVTPDKAVGVFGAFDTSAGNFEVGGSVTAYFTTVEAVRAVRRSADLAFNVIMAKENAGFVIDIPLFGSGGSKVNVEKDKAIMLPLEMAGAENPNGYTKLFNYFPYLPNVAMPQ